MTKKAKKSVAMLLAGMISLYNTIPVAAMDSMNADADAVLVSKEALFDVLDYVEPQKELFGLGHVDFSELCIGNPISTYEYLATGLEECAPIYPLFYDGEIVAIAKCPEGTYFQISTGQLTDELNAAVNGSAALIYDADGTYLFDGVMLTQIIESTFETSDRESLAENIALQNVSTFSLDSFNDVVETNEIDLALLEDAAPLNYVPNSTAQTYYSIPVDYVEQHEDMTCWAACIASISNAVKGTSYTSEYVVTKVAESRGLNVNDLEDNGRDPVYFTADMREIFNLGTYAFSADALTVGEVLSGIQNNRPCVGNYYRRDEFDNKFNHAVVMCGVHVTSSFATIMDPGQRYGGFYTSYHNGRNFTYTNDEGYTMTNDCGAYYSTLSN